MAEQRTIEKRIITARQFYGWMLFAYAWGLVLGYAIWGLHQ